MAIRLCAHNHYYDDEKYAVCPICLRAAQDGAPDATLTVVGKMCFVYCSAIRYIDYAKYYNINDIN